MATIKELHAKYKGILGYRRMTRFVNRQLGTNYNKKRIRRLMRILGMSSVIRRSRACCTKSSFVNIEENRSIESSQLMHRIRSGVPM